MLTTQYTVTELNAYNNGAEVMAQPVEGEDAVELSLSHLMGGVPTMGAEVCISIQMARRIARALEKAADHATVFLVASGGGLKRAA